MTTVIAWLLGLAIISLWSISSSLNAIAEALKSKSETQPPVYGLEAFNAAVKYMPDDEIIETIIKLNNASNQSTADLIELQRKKLAGWTQEDFTSASKSYITLINSLNPEVK